MVVNITISDNDKGTMDLTLSTTAAEFTVTENFEVSREDNVGFIIEDFKKRIRSCKYVTEYYNEGMEQVKFGIGSYV